MGLKRGSDFVLKIGNGVTPVEGFSALTGIRVTEFLLTNRLVDNSDVKTGSWRELATEAGLQHITIRANGLFNDDLPNDRLRLVAINNQKNNFKLEFGNGEVLGGNFVVTEYERSARYDAEELISITLESAGAIA